MVVYSTPSFRYYDDNSRAVSSDAASARAMYALGDALAASDPCCGAAVEPIVAKFGKFVAHDIISLRYRGQLSELPDLRVAGRIGSEIVPFGRDSVVDCVTNAKNGRADLGCVYLDGSGDRSPNANATHPIRHRHQPGKLAQSAAPQEVDDRTVGCMTSDLRGSFFLPVMVQLHNAIVEACTDRNVISQGSEGLYKWARARTRWTYQRLIAKAYLPAICDPNTLAYVTDSRAMLFTWFMRESHAAAARQMLLPLEFAFAGIWFPYSSALYGPGASSAMPSENVPSFPQPETTCEISEADILPSHPAHILATGFLINLPSAQALIDDLNAITGLDIPVLSRRELSNSLTDSAISETWLIEETPLWFYLCKEAEHLNGGRALGPLGSLVTGSTLLGLIIEDEDSFWHQPGTDAGRWHPRDDDLPNPLAIDDFKSLRDAAGKFR